MLTKMVRKKITALPQKTKQYKTKKKNMSTSINQKKKRPLKKIPSLPTNRTIKS